MDFPIRNYTLIVGGVLGPTLPAVPGVAMVIATLNSSNLTTLVSDQRFEVGVEVCGELICRNSSRTVSLSEYWYIITSSVVSTGTLVH